MSGEVYLLEDPRGWCVVHETRYGDSSGIEGPFLSDALAVAAAKDMAERFGARFSQAEARRSIASARRSALALVEDGAHG